MSFELPRCARPDCEGIVYSWLDREYCSKQCKVKDKPRRQHEAFTSAVAELSS